MESLNELYEAVKKINEITNKINDDYYAEIEKKAPLIIYQRFCAEFADLSRENPDKELNEIPKLMEILTAIRILGECFPELNKRGFFNENK